MNSEISGFTDYYSKFLLTQETIPVQLKHALDNYKIFIVFKKDN